MSIRLVTDKENVDYQAAIKKHYHIDCCPSNEYAIVPNGPDESLWLLPHGREKLSAK